MALKSWVPHSCITLLYEVEYNDDQKHEHVFLSEKNKNKKI